MNQTQFPFLTNDFLKKSITPPVQHVEILSIELIGDCTGLASLIGKVVVLLDGKKKFLVVKSYSALGLPSDGKGEKGESVSTALREVAFYKDFSSVLAPFVSIPRYYGSQRDLIDGIVCERIILEYVDSPWRLGNQIEGLSHKDIVSAVKAMAKLHSFPLESTEIPSWLVRGDSKEENGYFYSVTPYVETCVRKALPYLSGDITKEQENKMNTLLQEYAPSIPIGEIKRQLEGILCHWSDIIPRLADIPMKMIHVDFRAENLFFQNDTDEVLVVDWQNVSIAPAAMDLAYLISGSLTTNDRRVYEDELINIYIKERSRLDKETPTFEVLQKRYKISLLWPVIWAACTLSGVGELLDGINKTEKVARARATKFMIVTSNRYLQASIDHNSLQFFE